MSILRASSAIEGWLDDAAESWSLLSDSEYKSIVERWREVFSVPLERGSGVQGPDAVAKFEGLLPATVVMFNGVSVPQAAVGSVRHPHAYRAHSLQSVAAPIANEHDLVIVDQSFNVCCICTHEWLSLAHPIFVQSAA